MISLNKIIDLRKIGKFWHKRNATSQSCNIGTYTSPRLKKNIYRNEDDDAYLLTNIEHLYDDHVSNNRPTSFDEININKIKINQLCIDSVENIDNNLSNECVSYTSCMAICHNLFNHMKNGNKISKLIIGLLLELKEVINSKKKKINNRNLDKENR